MKPALLRLFILLLLAVVLTAPAYAHSKSAGTIPADGEVVKGTPPMIMLHFDKPLRITSISLKNAAGQEQALTQSEAMKKTVTMFEATPAALKPGRYQVDWRGLADDGHAMSGQFSFTVE